jgi:histidine ammonia-lyase
MTRVTLHGGSLTPEQVIAVARGGARVELADGARKKMAAGYQQLLQVEKQIGPVPLWKFADLADDAVRAQVSDVAALARQVIVDHAAAVGKPLATELVRAMMLVRADVLAQGHSGVRPELAQSLIDMLNAGVHPLVPSQGHLSMAGDTAALAHVALVLLDGGGRADGDTGLAVLGRHEDGARVLPGEQAMREAGIARWRPTLKESFSLIIGNTLAAAWAALLIADAEQLWRLAVGASALTCEAMLANTEAFDPALHELGPGREEVAHVARLICGWIGASTMAGPQDKTDAFSLRCIPQVLGPIHTVLNRAKEVITNELRLVSDNPVIVDGPQGPRCLDGGNFHGERLVLALDNLRLAVAEIGGLAERHAFIMTNQARSNGLPSFLVRERGLNSGFMLAQYTAAALVSENKTWAVPYAVDSIPTCQDYEDHAGFAALSAAATASVLTNVQRILAVELLCAAQGVDLRRENGKRPGRHTGVLVDTLRRVVPKWETDRVMYHDLAAAERLSGADGEATRLATEIAEKLDEQR